MILRALRLGAITLTLLTHACDGPPPRLDAGAEPVPSSIGPADRPARLFAPPAHDGVSELPLVVLLHGYTVDSRAQDLYFGLTRRARVEGFYLLLPDGTIDPEGEPHWDVLGLRVDDHAYLRALLEEAMAAVPVDRRAVSVVGHSNGGFMAYRLGCDSADLVTGIASLAGGDAIDGCAPGDDVALLQIHGTADRTVAYEGGSIAGLDYPAAEVAVATWAERVGCDPAGAMDGAALDLVTSVAGAETRTVAYGAGCRAAVELWAMEGVDHIPSLGAEFTPAVTGWLRAHRR